MLEDLLKKNRSYRRFLQDEAVSLDTLKELAGLSRLCASAANNQPLKFILSADREKNAAIFSCLAWAAYLKDWPGPAEGERPAAYILILGDKSIAANFWCDHGIAAQSILLGAVERGLGGCMLGAIQREKLREALEIPDHLEILLALALGKPKERVQIDPLGPDGSIKYWRDGEGVHHVPKRPLESLIFAAY